MKYHQVMPDDIRPDEWREVASVVGWAILALVAIWFVLAMLGTF